jgi:hypothetical protein
MADTREPDVARRLSIPQHESVQALRIDRVDERGRSGSHLTTGDLIPHFDVATVDGRRVRYADLWQDRNLVLMTLPHAAEEPQRVYISRLRAALSALVPDDTTLVVAIGIVQDLPSSSIVVADRWGEIVHVAPLAPDVSTWLPLDDVLEWVQYIRIQCPECPP